MSKFCHKCGSRLNDVDVFCEICGEKQAVLEHVDIVAEEQSIVEPETEPVVEPIVEPVTEQPKVIAKKPSKSFWIGIGGAIAAVVLIAVLAIVFAQAPYQRVVDDYFDILYNGEVQKMKWLAPEEYWDHMEEEYDMSMDDVIDSFEEYGFFDDVKESLKEEYGRNIEVTYKIADQDALSEKKLDTIREGLKTNYDIAKRDVGKGYKLEIDVTIDGSKDTDTEEVDLFVVELNGEWYVVSSSGTVFPFDF